MATTTMLAVLLPMMMVVMAIVMDIMMVLKGAKVTMIKVKMS